MKDAATNLARSKSIITSACLMLEYSRDHAPSFAREAPGSDADCYILLHDATRLFCRYVSEQYGEESASRWSPALPEVLLAHPEKCNEALALVERQDYQPISHFHFVAA